MVFPKVANMLVKKEPRCCYLQVELSKEITPWQMYVQVRALENRIPILVANVENHRFGGNSIVVDLTENNKVMTTKITKLNRESEIIREFKLDKYEKSKKIRFSDSNKFQ